MARIFSAIALDLVLCTSTFASCAILIIDDDDGLSPEPTWVACTANSECTLIADGCCDACGAPGLDDVTPVNRRHADDYRRRLCPRPVICASCPAQSAPNLLATCAGARCSELDLRTHPASACERDTDCRPRTTGCCECGGSTAPPHLIAIGAASEALYRELVCDPGQACPECLPPYPGDVEAHCAADGHCALRPNAGSSPGTGHSTTD